MEAVLQVMLVYLALVDIQKAVKQHGYLWVFII